MEPPTREQLESMFKSRRLAEEDRARMSAQQLEQHETFGKMLLDLRWPVNREGDVMDVSFVAAWVAYHLTRCGWRNDPDKRVIKGRKPLGRGIATGAVEWVSMDEPDDELEGLQDMSLRELSSLSPAAKFEAIRRLGGQAPDIREPTGWTVKPNLSITDAPMDGFLPEQVSNDSTAAGTATDASTSKGAQ